MGGLGFRGVPERLNLKASIRGSGFRKGGPF